MYLLRLKYKYARASGYDTFWVCSLLHPGAIRIPLMSVPLNITPMLKGIPYVIVSTVSENAKTRSVPFHVINQLYRPDWYFKIGESSDEKSTHM